jgi:hypothetical protein
MWGPELPVAPPGLPVEERGLQALCEYLFPILQQPEVCDARVVVVLSDTREVQDLEHYPFTYRYYQARRALSAPEAWAFLWVPLRFSASFPIWLTQLALEVVYLYFGGCKDVVSLDHDAAPTAAFSMSSLWEWAEVLTSMPRTLGSSDPVGQSTRARATGRARGCLGLSGKWGPGRHHAGFGVR